MSDRLNGLTVVLEQDIREEEARPLIDAIKQMRGVLNVQPLVVNFEIHLAESRVRRELGQKLWEVLYPKKQP